MNWYARTAIFITNRWWLVMVLMLAAVMLPVLALLVLAPI